MRTRSDARAPSILTHRSPWASAKLALLCTLFLSLSACEKADPAGHGTAATTPARQVVVYCSADAPVAQPVFDAFEKRTGITVKAVFDTEATKTTGLVNRLLSEQAPGGRSEGTCDVWWSSEPFGTVRLSRAGVLEKYSSVDGDRAFAGAGGRPASLRGTRGDWYGFALRERVIIWNTRFVEAPGPDFGWDDLLRPRLKGRIGMARPQFGTTRGHAASLSWCEPESLKRLLSSCRENGLRLFDGNAAVAKAVASGELFAGLTDSDDAINGSALGWPVAWKPIGLLTGAGHSTSACNQAGRAGPLRFPNTAAVVRGGPHPGPARLFLDYLLTADCERMLRDGEAHAIPTLPSLAPAGQPGPVVGAFDWEAIADQMDAAMATCEEVLHGL